MVRAPVRFLRYKSESLCRLSARCYILNSDLNEVVPFHGGVLRACTSTPTFPATLRCGTQKCVSRQIPGETFISSLIIYESSRAMGRFKLWIRWLAVGVERFIFHFRACDSPSTWLRLRVSRGTGRKNRSLIPIVKSIRVFKGNCIEEYLCDIFFVSYL